MREHSKQCGRVCSDAGECAVRFHDFCTLKKGFGECAVMHESVQQLGGWPERVQTMCTVWDLLT